MREKRGFYGVSRIDLSSLLAMTFMGPRIQLLLVVAQRFMGYKTLKVEELESGTIVRVTLCRPKARNAINLTLFEQIGHLFAKLEGHPTARVVIIDGDGPLFTSGLDTKEMGFIFSLADKQDGARNAASIYRGVMEKFQDHVLRMHRCRLPVLVGTHKMCLGIGVDFISSADIRFCTRDCVFAVREIELGIATDVGSLQFLPKITGNSSAFKELAFTGRDFGAQEALIIGFVSRAFETKEELFNGLLETAKSIAAKSPVGMNAVKSAINHGQSSNLQNLQYVARVNSAMLQTKDAFQAFNAYIAKRATVFPKL